MAKKSPKASEVKKAGGAKSPKLTTKLGIGVRIWGISGILIGLMLLVSLIGITKTQQIGVQIVAVAERDMPLTRVVTDIEVGQLEQSVIFERAVRFGEHVATGRLDLRSRFESEVKHFEELSHEVSAAIVEGEELAQASIAHAATAAEREEFERVLHALEVIEVEHQGFEEHAVEIFEMMQRGVTVGLEEAIAQVEAEEEKLNGELVALAHEIAGFTQHALEQAEADEKSALSLMMILSAISVVVGGVASFFIVGGIVGPVKKMTAAMGRLANDDLEVEIVGQTRGDEIGAIARAVQVFKDNAIKLAALGDAQQLSEMVEAMPIGVMMADPKTFEINFLNKFSKDTLKTLEQFLPVKADELMGQCIDIFHKNPAHQRGILGDPQNLPHNAQIHVGPEILDLLIRRSTTRPATTPDRWSPGR